MKLVPEYLNEVQHFTRGLDPKEAMSIGEKPRIEKWLKEKNIKNYLIYNDLTISIHENIFIGWEDNFTGFPNYIHIIKIAGTLHMQGLKNMKTLDNFPKLITGDLLFYENGVKLTEKYLKEHDIVVYGKKELISRKEQEQQFYHKNYKERGPIASRKTHTLGPVTDFNTLNTHYGYSKGVPYEKLYTFFLAFLNFFEFRISSFEFALPRLPFFRP